MKKLLILLSLLIPFILSAQQQQEDTLRYMKYPNAYGPQYTTGWFTKLFRLPDTASMRPQHGVPGAFGRNADGTKTFSWDGDEWIRQNVSSIDSMFISSTDSIFIIRDNDTTFIGLNGSSGVDTVYSSNDSLYGVKNGVTFFIDNLQFFPNGLNQPGYVTWSGSGLTFDVTAAIFTIDQITYSSASGSITLDPADPDNPRYDVIAVDTTGAIVKITGTAGVNPSIPQADPNSQIYLTAVYIAAGATIPGDVVQNIIYDENTESYTGAATGVTVNLNNTVNPFHLVKSADVNTWSSGGKTLVFTKNSGLDDINNYSVLKLFIYLKVAISGSANIRVSFYNGSTAVSNVLTLGNGNGFSKATSGAYQNVTVPLSAFTFSSAIFDKLRITFAGNAGGAYIDYVQLQGGITQPNPSQIYQDTTYKRNDTLFGLKNNKEFFIAKDIRDTAKLSAGWPLYFADVDNFYAPNGLNKAITIDSSALSDYIVQVINNDTTTGQVINNADFIVKFHSNAPVADVSGDKYLVGTSPTGSFAGHTNAIAEKVGAVYTFTDPDTGDNLIVNNATTDTYQSYHFNGTDWELVSILALVGGNSGVGNVPLGTKDATDLHLISNGITAVLIDTNSNVSVIKFIGTPSNNFAKFDSATGNFDTGYFRQLIAGSNITITHGATEDTISAIGGSSALLPTTGTGLATADVIGKMQGHQFDLYGGDATFATSWSNLHLFGSGALQWRWFEDDPGVSPLSGFFQDATESTIKLESNTDDFLFSQTSVKTDSIDLYSHSEYGSISGDLAIKGNGVINFRLTGLSHSRELIIDTTTFQFGVNGTLHYLPLSVNGNYADNTGNIIAGGITTLNTLTGSTQTFATGTSGSDFNISSASTTHTFNIPTASASNRGLLSTTDWSTFNGKLSNITGLVTAGSNIGLTGSGTSGSPYIVSTSAYLNMDSIVITNSNNQTIDPRLIIRNSTRTAGVYQVPGAIMFEGNGSSTSSSKIYLWASFNPNAAGDTLSMSTYNGRNFYVTGAGSALFGGTVTGAFVGGLTTSSITNNASNNGAIIVNTGTLGGSAGADKFRITGTSNGSTGSSNLLAVEPIYNGSGIGTGPLIDVYINRTETSLGSTTGIQRLIWAGVGGTEKFGVDNVGNLNTAGTASIYTTATGTAGTDSILVQSGGLIKKISPTYYGTGGSYTAGRGIGISGSVIRIDTSQRLTWYPNGADFIDTNATLATAVTFTKQGTWASTGVVPGALFRNVLQRSGTSGGFNIASTFTANRGTNNIAIMVDSGAVAINYQNANNVTAATTFPLQVYAYGTGGYASYMTGTSSNSYTDYPLARFDRTNSSAYPTSIQISNGLTGATALQLSYYMAIGNLNGGTRFAVQKYAGNIGQQWNGLENNVLLTDVWYSRLGINMGASGSSPIGLFEAKNSGMVIGTGAVTSGGSTLTGTSTTFLSDFKVGDQLTIATVGGSYTVASIASNTSLTITSTWAASASAQAITNTTTTNLEQIVSLTNGRTGIGTSSPTNTFHVNGDVRISTIATGVVATDSVVVVNGGVLKAVAPFSTGISTVNGTTNRITSTGGTTPTIDISASYVGQSSITTLGTIATGTWNGTAIANANLANSTISGISLGSNLANLTATDASLTLSRTYNGSAATTIGVSTPIDVFAVGGQSNGVGHGDSALSPIPVASKAIYYTNGVIYPVKDPVANAVYGSFIPAFAINYNNTTGKAICFVPSCKDGSSMAQGGNPSSNTWDTAGTLYNVMIARVDSTMDSLRAHGYNPTFKGVLWVQGEADGDDVNNAITTVAQYKAAFRKMVKNTRSHFSDTTAFYIFRTGVSLAQPTAGYLAIAQAEEDNCDSMNGVYMVYRNTLDFGARSLLNTVHYKQAGLNEMGTFGADEVINHDKNSDNAVKAQTNKVGIGVQFPLAFVDVTANTTIIPAMRFGRNGTLTTTPMSMALEATNSALYFTDTVATVVTRRQIPTLSNNNTFTGTNIFSGLTLADATNIIINTTTGTKIGTSTSQKLAFYNSTPIVQPSGNVLTALSNLGLIASPTLPNLTATDATLTFSGTYDGTTARTIGLNLANANTWTAEQNIQLTTEQLKLSYDGSNNATFTVGSTGNLTLVPSGGQLILNAGLQTFTTAGSSNLTVVAPTGTGQNLSASTLTFAGASQVTARRYMRGSANNTITVANSYAGTIFGQESATIAASGTHALFATAVFKPVNITAGSGTVTNSATAYIEDAPAGATNNYAIWSDAGTNRFDGNVIANGNVTLGTAGSSLNVTEGTNGRVGQTVLVTGTKAITISGLTTSSRAFVQLVSPSGATSTVQYQAVCTTNTLTIQANLAATTINTADGSTLNYFIIN